MKNKHNPMALKLVLGFAASISLWAQITLASSTEDLTDLINLLDTRGISVSTNPSALLGEKSAVVLSRGQLTEAQVAAYNDKYDRPLLVLPLTTKLLDESVINDEEEDAQERDKLFAAALSQGTIVYLYINPNHFNDSKDGFSDQLSQLLGEDFQNKLKNSRFAALPAEYIQQWGVSLGNVEPEYPGGYK